MEIKNEMHWEFQIGKHGITIGIHELYVSLNGTEIWIDKHKHTINSK